MIIGKPLILDLQQQLLSITMRKQCFRHRHAILSLIRRNRIENILDCLSKEQYQRKILAQSVVTIPFRSVKSIDYQSKYYVECALRWSIVRHSHESSDTFIYLSPSSIGQLNYPRDDECAIIRELISLGAMSVRFNNPCAFGHGGVVCPRRTPRDICPDLHSPAFLLSISPAFGDFQNNLNSINF